MYKKLEDALSHLDRLGEYFPRVETKATFLLALNSGLLAFLCMNVAIGKSFVAHVHGISLVFLFLILISYYELFKTFFPNLGNGATSSLIYFGSVGSMSKDEFLRRVNEASDNDFINDALEQIWINSEILKNKYYYCSNATKITVMSMLPWALVLITSAIQNNKLNFS